MQQQSARNARAGAHDFQGPADIATAPASSEKQAEPLARGVQVYSPQSRLGVLIFSCDEKWCCDQPAGNPGACSQARDNTAPLHLASYRKGRASLLRV